MNKPIFKLIPTVCSSSSQFFLWKTGVKDSFVLSDCSIAEVNGTYDFVASGSYNTLYYRNSTHADNYMVCQNNGYEMDIYLCQTILDITTMTMNQAYSYALAFYACHPTRVFSEVWYRQMYTEMTEPTINTINKGSGYFSYKIDDGEYSEDIQSAETTINNLEDLSSHSFHVREKLTDNSYSEDSSVDFNVVFSSGTITPKARLSTIETDQNSLAIDFSIADYDLKRLSGLTQDPLSLMGLYGFAGTKYGVPYYTKTCRDEFSQRDDTYYLFYSPRFARWMLLSLASFNAENDLTEYYWSEMFSPQVSGPETFPTNSWMVGETGWWNGIGGAPTWTSGAYHVIPIGTKTHRYKIDNGSYITLNSGVDTFNITTTVGNNYIVYISELLDNGLWTSDIEVNVNCTLLDAPTVTTGDGLTTSADGRNILLKWDSIGHIDFDGTSYATPIFWDEATAVAISTPYGAGKKFHVTNLKSPNGCFIAFKLLPNTTYYVMVVDEVGNMQNAEYKPDGTLYRGIHDYEYAWESIETGSNGGIWEYQTVDQGSWGDFSLAVYPPPEVMTEYDQGTFYSDLTGAITGTGIFRFKINSGPWSAETTEKTNLQTVQLPTGVNNIQVQEKSINNIWGNSGTMELTVIAGAETGTGGGISVPSGKYIIVFNPATGKEFLWDGVASITGLDTMFV